MEYLWGKKAKVSYLLIGAALMLLTALGGREIWTQEHRWADIVNGMFYRHDFLHPFLGENDYYDKPLLSYWCIAALSYITGHLSLWTLRLPSAIAGVISVWSIYRLGTLLKDKSFGLLSGWLLVTTFYFVFWSRTSSADMLNMAGTLLAVTWYFAKREQSSFINYCIFFMILAVTSLFKGLVGAVVPLLVILPDLLANQQWKKHLSLTFLVSPIPAILIYLAPFWLSVSFGGEHYQESGLYLVYKENVLRYFQPFDHKGPIYTYFIFLPIYLLPWAIFFIPALCSLPSRWKNMSASSRWMVWSVVLLFLFLTGSGSRRNYYVLPMVPFAILMTADWLLANKDQLAAKVKWLSRLVVIFFLVLFLNFNVVQPWYYAQSSIPDFAKQLKQESETIKPWSDWQVVLLDSEAKVQFYLNLPPSVKNLSVVGNRKHQTTDSLLAAWPIVAKKDSNTLLVTRKQYVQLLQPVLTGYKIVAAKESFFNKHNPNAPVAFIPVTN